MDVDDALELIEEIGELLEREEILDVWHKAPDFFEDIQEKVGDIEETIRKTNNVTPNQASALRNWKSGVEKWIHDS